MAPARWIYMFEPEGRVLAVTVTLGEKGEACFEPGDNYFDRIMSSIGEGVYSRREKRSIGPAEGEAFLQAVEDMYDRSSTWIVDDAPPPDPD